MFSLQSVAFPGWEPTMSGKLWIETAYGIGGGPQQCSVGFITADFVDLSRGLQE